MKVVRLEWAFMTSTIECPVLEAGKIISLVGWEKGQQQLGGRFPALFAVVTDDTVVSSFRGYRAYRPANALKFCDLKKQFKIVKFAWEDKCEEVATAWATKQ